MICPQNLVAEGFTGEEFATWEIINQRSYIQTSVMMAGVVATQVKPEISQCIDTWFFLSDETLAREASAMAAVIEQYPAHHPSGVILALVQQKCGKFE